MYILKRFITNFKNHLTQLNALGVILILLFYLLSSWLVLFLLGESELADPNLFFYWLVVTASTVGYGDYSPTTFSGQMFVALYVIPVGLSLFALIVGRVAGVIVDRWQQGLRGFKNVNFEGHILVIGWRGQSSMEMINLLKEEAIRNKQRQIVLCVDQDMQNPMPGEIEFVKVESYSYEQEMARTNLDKADTIIVCARSDDLTFTTSLFCHKRNPDAHMIAWFEDENLSRLLLEHCPSVEVAPSLNVEIMVKAAMDPGSSQLHRDLLSIQSDMTQFSLQYDAANIAFMDLFTRFKSDWQAILIAVKNPGQDQVLNPSNDFQVASGAQLYYIADQRLKHIQW